MLKKCALSSSLTWQGCLQHEWQVAGGIFWEGGTFYGKCLVEYPGIVRGKCLDRQAGLQVCTCNSYDLGNLG